MRDDHAPFGMEVLSAEALGRLRDRHSSPRHEKKWREGEGGGGRGGEVERKVTKKLKEEEEIERKGSKCQSREGRAEQDDRVLWFPFLCCVNTARKKE